MPDYAFFFSYARVDSEDGPYLAQFFTDLANAVRREVPLHSGTPVRDIGFFDNRSISTGEKWDDAVVDGLQKAHSLVAVLSPGYVSSDGCGREFTVFRDRLERARGTAAVRHALLLPIMWSEPSNVEVPAALSVYQRTNADLGPTYATQGLRYLAEQSRTDPEYHHLIDRLAVLLAR